MKKLVLLAIVATFATSAFAQKGLVELQGCFDGQCDTLDFRQVSNNDNDEDFTKNDDDDYEAQNLYLNYNHLFTDNFGAGIVYKQSTKTVDGKVLDTADVQEDNSTTTGINLFWNLDSGWMGHYVALRYWMTTIEEDEDSSGTKGKNGVDRTDTVLEFGTRVALGKALGVSFAWNPSVQYTMTAAENDANNSEDYEETSLTIMPVNFAVAF